MGRARLATGMELLAEQSAVDADRQWCWEVCRDGIAPWAQHWFGWDEVDQRRRFDERWSADEVEILCAGGRRIGWWRVFERGDGLYLDALYLAQDARGHGLGTAAVRLLQERTGELTLGVLKNNPALRLYRRLGFRVEADGGHKWHCRWSGWSGPLPMPEFTGPDGEQLALLCEQHGLAGTPQASPEQGRANHTYLLDDAVLRVATATADGLSDARTEVVAISAARAAEVPTPALRAFDETGRVVPVPVTAMDRVAGRPAGGEPGTAWAEAGAALARLHQLTEVPDAGRWLDEPRHSAPETWLHAAPDEAPHLGRWAAELPADEPEPRFLHNDLHAKNLLVHEGRLAALIDWGDAGWGDPALDFEPMPIERVPEAVAAYRAAAGPADDELEGRILRAHLGVALRRIAEPKPGRRPRAKLNALLAFARSGPAGAWARWIPAVLLGCAPVGDRGDLRPEARVVLELARTSAEPVTLAHALGIEDATVPQEIRVWRRGLDGSTSSCAGRVDTLPLEDYVAGVLPKEWVASWRVDSLDAGAIAARTYAAFWARAGGRYACADLDDTTWSQVYGDERHEATDAAVRRTEGVVAVLDESLVFAEYSAEHGAESQHGAADPLCRGQKRSGHGRGVCQWGTQRWAQTGRNAEWMIGHYYPGARARLPDEDLVDGIDRTVYSGERFRLALRASNAGDEPWPRGSVSVGTEPSAFEDPSWRSPTRPRRLKREVPPGEVARVRWWMVAPEVDEPTTYAEFFYLDGPATDRPGSAGTWNLTVLPSAEPEPEPEPPARWPWAALAGTLAVLLGAGLWWRRR